MRRIFSRSSSFSMVTSPTLIELRHAPRRTTLPMVGAKSSNPSWFAIETGRCVVTSGATPPLPSLRSVPGSRRLRLHHPPADQPDLAREYLAFAVPFGRATTKSCATHLRQLQLSGQSMVQATLRGSKARVPSRRALPASRLYRDEPIAAG